MLKLGQVAGLRRSHPSRASVLPLQAGPPAERHGQSYRISYHVKRLPRGKGTSEWLTSSVHKDGGEGDVAHLPAAVEREVDVPERQARATFRFERGKEQHHFEGGWGSDLEQQSKELALIELDLPPP